MTYTEAEVAAANAAIDKYRSGEDGEIGTALAVVGLSAERAAGETAVRDDMIRVAHRAVRRCVSSPRCPDSIARP